MRQLSSLFIILAACCCLTIAQVPFPSVCPQVKLPEQFDLGAYTGIWYEYSKYPFVFEIGKKCIYARYGDLGNGTVSVENVATNRITGSLTNIKGTAKVLGPGQLAVQFSRNQPADKPNYIVLGTDYTSYAVVYSCINLTTLAHTKIIWILTRDRHPTVQAITAAKQVIDDNKLSQSFLMDTNQEGCTAPTDAANAGGASADATTPSAQPTNAVDKA